LEFLPKEYHYLLTFMSVFFSFGAVFASILGYIILPSTSCPEPTPDDPSPPCDLATQNRGWRILLFCVGLLTLIMLAARSFCLRLPETPKFLLNNNKHKETLIVLQDIAKMNGNGHVDIQPLDLQRQPPKNSESGSSHDGDYEDNGVGDGGEDQERDGLLTSPHFTNKSNDLGSRDTTPHSLSPPQQIEQSVDMDTSPTHHRNRKPLLDEMEHPSSSSPDLTSVPAVSSTVVSPTPMNHWSILLSPRWRRTVFLIWGIWTFTSVAFTMFNVFLPKYLETLGYDDDSPPTRKDVYWDYMIYSMAGVPGSGVSAGQSFETILSSQPILFLLLHR
jgi:hypothetical protein